MNNVINVDARVILQINNHTFEMTKQEALTLYNKLHEFFGRNISMDFTRPMTNPWEITCNGVVSDSAASSF